MTKLLDTCARELMDTAPKIVQAIRIEMRRGHGTDLSIPQFRTMAFVQHNADASLSDLADHLGLTLPSASKLVDGLVKQKLISRQESVLDRRRLTLVLTPDGESIVHSAREGALANLTKIISHLSKDELVTIHQAMELLSPLFASQGKQSLVKK
jgi:MarR family transcriptional regulator for hemolysin